ncbi:MAG: AbrB/MazE/SpoVT family DNA-binding domain-containing protein [Ruminococcaceae bacterium]|nr:AbrB/MazE/SpoVT family DNA-binding domain-containing protein [Oscillospiraceae bacterium]
MKSTGMIRGVDRMGRVVIPKEIRKQLKIQNDIDSFEIFVEDDSVILKKYEPKCIFCGKNEASLEMNGHNVCRECIEKLYELRDTIE